MSEKFNVCWNDFHSNASKSFKKFRDESYLHDVTLISDDFKRISAHKLVLSACSEYFRNIFQQTKQQSHPFLCLDGVNFTDMQNVLNYVYEGEANLHQEDLERFLTIAQRLKLDGLELDCNTDMKCEENISKSKSFREYREESYLHDVTLISNDNKQISPHKLEDNVSNDQACDVNKDNDNEDVKRKKREWPMTLNGEPINENKLKDILSENCVRNTDNTFSCKVCDRSFTGTNIAIAKRHIEIHIEGLNYACSLCDKNFKTKNSVSNHVYTAHKGTAM